MDKFEETLNNILRFNTYTLAMATLVKSVKVLKERGADEKATSFILSGVDILIKQLEDAAQKVENKKLVEELLAELKKNNM